MSVFIIPRNDRNDVGMTQEWLEMSFLIIPRNDRNDVGMMVWLIQCPFLSFLSFMIFLCHSFISASFHHLKLIWEWWAMGKMRNDVEWMTKVDYFPYMESCQLHPIHSHPVHPGMRLEWEMCHSWVIRQEQGRDGGVSIPHFIHSYVILI